MGGKQGEQNTHTHTRKILVLVVNWADRISRLAMGVHMRLSSPPKNLSAHLHPASSPAG